MNRGPLATIRANLAHTGLSVSAEVRRADAFALLCNEPDRRFDYIYLAPPQYQGLWHRALQALNANWTWLQTDGWAVAQIDPKEYAASAFTGLEEFDKRKYGTTVLAFFTPRSS